VATDDRDRKSPRGHRDRVLTALFGCALAFIVVAPLTRRGWLLLLDWVPGPRQIGATGGALPTGPLFGLPVRGAYLLFGAAVGWIPLAVALVLASAGAARLIDGPWPARISAGVAFAWNPFVYDRIAVGQMSVLLGYALLPWLLRAAWRANTRRDVVVVAVWWAAMAACTLHFAWIGGVVVLAAALVRVPELGAARAIRAFTIALVFTGAFTAVWVLFAPHAASPRGTSAVLTTFATRPDPDLGRGLGILAQQGFWRTVVTRPRDDLGVFFAVVAGASVATAVLGLCLARGTKRARLAGIAALSGLAGFMLAFGNRGPFGFAYTALFLHLPGFGMMREAQKWAALVCLAIAVGTGCFAAALAHSRWPRLAWAVVAIPIALAPTMAWGLDGRIALSHYPVDWAAVRAAVDAQPGPVVALPWEEYPAPVITGDRTVANLAPAYFGTRVVTSRDPDVPGLPGDTGIRAEIATAVGAASAQAATGAPLHLGADLAHLGYRGVLVVGPDALPLVRDPELREASTGTGIALWVVTGGH
jgi:hypothetical protein